MPSIQSLLAIRPFFARPMLALLSCLIAWLGICPWIAPAMAETASDWIRIETPGLISAQVPPLDLDPADRSDAWTNATYAFGGSALSNGIVLVVILGSTLLNEAFAEDAPTYLNMTGPATLVLFGTSVIGTPLLMHAWSPEAEPEQLVFSALGSLAGTGAAALALVPLALVFQQDDFNNTFLTLLPAAFIVTVLFQGLGAAWGHELAADLRRGSSNSVLPEPTQRSSLGPEIRPEMALRSEIGLIGPAQSRQSLSLLNYRWVF